MPGARPWSTRLRKEQLTSHGAKVSAGPSPAALGAARWTEPSGIRPGQSAQPDAVSPSSPTTSSARAEW